MKKKIINGILMVAMLFAATTSFVSCKDNVDDELIPVYAELAKVRSNLEVKISSIESQIAALQQQEGENAAAIAALQTELAAINSELDAVNQSITTLSGDVDKLQSDLDALTKRVDDLEETVNKLIDSLDGILDKLILDFQVENTLNDVLGTINVPGFNLKSLAAFYGENLSGIEEFPFAGSDYNVGGDYFDSLEDADIKDASLWHFFEEYYITSKSGNAGKVFFTVETPDPATFDISEYTLSVENSVGYTFPIWFDDVKKSAYQAQWGIYKSGNVNTEPEDAPADGTYYQARANIEPKDIEAAKFDLKKFIDYKNLESDFKQIVADVKAAEGKKNTAKQIAKEAAKLVANIYSGNMSGNNQDIKNPTWSAQRLVLSKENPDGSISKRRTALDLALTAATPLSYNSFWELEGSVDGIIGVDRLEQIVYKLAEAIKAKLPEINLGDANVNITKVQAPTVEDDGYVLVNNTKDATTGQAKVGIEADIINPLVDAINAGLDLDNLNAMINEISGTSVDLGPTVDNLADRFSSYLEAAANKIVTVLNNHALTRAVAPIILYKSSEGISQLRYGTKVQAGYMQINMTSPTEELIVPAYAKYIAVVKDGEIKENHTYAGRTQMVDLDLREAGEYTIILSCVDYYGYVITKKYLVTVE